jgi:radical SAM protein with 4Fe4S-binding SPASM domain
MTMDTFVRLQPLMRRSARVHLQGWGEPFLNPAFFTMAALAKKAGCAVSTTTCGLGMDARRVQEIVASGMDIVAFSLVGSDAAGNAQRHGVDFEEVCRSIASLRAARDRGKGTYPAIHIAYLLLASNIMAVAGLPALMQRLGIDGAVISTLDYLAAPELIGETFLLEDVEKIERAGTVLKKAAAEANELGLGFHYQFPFPSGMKHGCTENINRSLFVSADGSVSPCVFVGIPASSADAHRIRFGNVNDESVRAIWESPEYQLFRRRLADGDPEQPCKSCRKRIQL